MTNQEITDIYKVAQEGADDLKNENEYLGSENERLHGLLVEIDYAISLNGEEYTDSQVINMIYNIIKHEIEKD